MVKSNSKPTYLRSRLRQLGSLAVLLSITACQGSDSSITESMPSEVTRLASLGYLGGYKAPSRNSGVLHLDEDHFSNGYTLVAYGHSPTASLLSSEGQELHTWNVNFKEAFPNYEFNSEIENRERTNYWRYVKLLPNGDLLAVFEGIGLVKLNKDSTILWARANHAHHCLDVLENGTIVVLSREVEQISGKVALVDYVLYLDNKGKEIKRLSILKSVLNSPYRAELMQKTSIEGDIFHTNSIQVLDKRVSIPSGMKNGDLLLSLRNINALAVLRPDSGQIVWWKRGIFHRQHDARVILNGDLMLFDNLGAKKYSRVLKFEMPDLKLKSNLDQLPDQSRFFSKLLGMAQQLPNGNILVAESVEGRILEVTPSGTLAWEYVSPYRAGDKKDLVAVIGHVERVNSVTFLSKHQH